MAFADLGATTSCAQVADVVAGAVDAGGRAPADLAALIGDAPLLLVIDSAEHVLDGVSPLVEELLARCPDVRILATSREPLDLSGEVRWRVPPLTLPPEDVPSGPDGLDEFDSIRLFTERAREHHPPFELTRENATTVMEICRRLDGMPLALELAAARVGALGLEEMACRLVDSLRLLARGPRNAVPRQRTLRATIDWSHDLLDDAERALFRRLAVFAGSFDLPAAEAVGGDPQLASGEVVEVLHRLVDKSLVVPHSRTDGRLRYRLMEVLRQYARERLAEADESDVRARHARYYADLAARLADQHDVLPAFVALMDVEYDNVQLALDWAEAEDAALQVSLVLSLGWLWKLRGQVREARDRTAAALRRDGSDTDRRGFLLARAAEWSRYLGDLEALRAQVEEAFALLPHIQDRKVASLVLNEHAFVRFLDGDLDGAQNDLTSALNLQEGRLPTRRLANTLNNLAMALMAAGKLLDGLHTVDQALVVAGQLQAEDMRAHMLHTRGMGMLALHQGGDARDCFLGTLAYAAGHVNQTFAIPALTGLAWTAAEARQPELCLELLGAAHRCVQIAGVSEDRLTEPQTVAAEEASRAALGPGAAEAAWSRGTQMDLGAALDRARRWDTPSNIDPPLTRRKLEVVRLVAAGLSNKEIAQRMSISERTAEAHLEQLRRQFGFHNRAQLAVWAASQNLLEPPP